MAGTNRWSSRYERSGVLLTSAGRGWRGISAELRSHTAGEIAGYQATRTEIGIGIRGTTVVTRQGGGVQQRIFAPPGTIGLIPAGAREDFAHVSKFVEEILHIYLELDSFTALSKKMSQPLGPAKIRYDAGFRDPLIETIARELIGELNHETSCGDLFAETLADCLAIRLLNSYSNLAGAPVQKSSEIAVLDNRRLNRVMDYIEQNLTQGITIDQLSSIAALSRFHFSRMFKATTGLTPMRYISGRRLDLARSLLIDNVSVSQVAQLCGFSSDSNFARAFRRATGLTPSDYRHRRLQ